MTARRSRLLTAWTTAGILGPVALDLGSKFFN
jgi:hypothetical protein